MRWCPDRAALLALALLAAACSSVGGVRDLTAIKTWDQRGETVGEFLYIYCRRAAPREQLIFRWGVERTIGPHRLTIVCAEEEPK